MSFYQEPKWTFVAAAAGIAGVTLGWGVFAWRSSVITVQEQRNYTATRQLLAVGRASEALAIIDSQNRVVEEPAAETRAKWLALEIMALGQAGNVPRLLALYDRAPKTFERQEPALLQVARAFLHAADYEAYDRLRDDWRVREVSPPAWLDLDVDELFQQGKRDEGARLLEAHSFSGEADCGRLVRLALLNSPGNFTAAWNYLDRAAALDPRNPDVHLFRGRVLERAGKLPAAQAEYFAALAANTNSAFLRDQLGEFFRRSGAYEPALRTWGSGLTNSATSDVIWLHTLFWSKVARPTEFAWASASPPYGRLRPFLQYLLDLPPGEFWNEAAFEKSPRSFRYAQQRQETFWLKLLAMLKAGKEDEAMKLIELNRFRSASWHPDLESALLRVLIWRKTGEMKFPASVNFPASAAPPKPRPPLFDKIDFCARNPKDPMPGDLNRLLCSTNVCTAVFLAGGWAEAALQLPHDEIIPDGFPEWVAAEFTQAYRLNRGNRPALIYAFRQKPSPALNLLVGEILLANDQFNEGLKKLDALATTDSETGSRAALAIARSCLQRQQYDQARAAVVALPRLRQSLAGQELLARAALLQNDKPAAEKIYADIETDSDDAKAYFAQQAFVQKNWPRARSLTEELLRRHPEQTQFQASLEAIAKAEAGK